MRLGPTTALYRLYSQSFQLAIPLQFLAELVRGFLICITTKIYRSIQYHNRKRIL
jgi:uncharacterized integral membrane protein